MVNRKRVLITGGNGMIGRALSIKLVERGFLVRISSRHPRSPEANPSLEWIQTSFEADNNLETAVADVDIVIHCATGNYAKAKEVDVEGTRRLLAISGMHSVEHIVYVSIVGVDNVPDRYLSAKSEAEQLIRASDVPFTIIRASQVYEGFIEQVLEILTKLPVGLIPKGFLYQPIGLEDLTNCMTELIMKGPNNETLDVLGPSRYELIDLARTWLGAQGIRKPLLQIPIPGKFGEAMRSGNATNSDKGIDGLTWEEWLTKRFG